MNRFRLYDAFLQVRKNMPLTNNVIIKLNEITTMVEDKNNLKDSETEEIKSIFKIIIETGERYDLDDIESWFENEGSWTNKTSRVRIVNLAHYVQNKFQQTLKLKIISDDDCGCGD
jgi:hypothetical protein